ncbi:MAG: HRDC domain-containing protein [Candidatus Latescibacterota bacterium]
MALVVRKAVCGVARVHGRFGLQVAARLPRGAPDEHLRWAGLEGCPTFGVLSHRSERWVTRLLRRCVTAGCVDFQGGDQPVAVVTPTGWDVVHARRPARLLLPRDGPAHKGVLLGLQRPSRVTGAPATHGGEDPGTAALFAALRRYRLEQARQEGVPPYVVASDRTLRDLARLRPRTLAELLQAYGIGTAKAAKPGAGILEVTRLAPPAARAGPGRPGPPERTGLATP